MLNKPHNSALSRKSEPFRKCAGESARRISRCWSKPGSQWTSLAARHFGPLYLMERPNLPNSCWKKVQTSITTSRTWCSLMLPPPVTEAARSNDFPMVRWLVEQGADITIADKYGDRPYTVAVQNKNQEMADYLKALEPEEWHNEQEKIRQLMPYKLPAKLVEYLKTGPLRLEFPDQEWVKWAELYSFMDVQEMTWKRKKLLSLMVQMDNYSDYLLLWSPRDKKLWYLDIEHEEFHPLAKWDDFIADPGRYLNGMIEGEFEE